MIAFSEKRIAESARSHDSLPSPVSIKRRSWPVPMTYVFVPGIAHYYRFCKRRATGSTLESELCYITIRRCG